MTATLDLSRNGDFASLTCDVTHPGDVDRHGDAHEGIVVSFYDPDFPDRGFVARYHAENLLQIGELLSSYGLVLHDGTPRLRLTPENTRAVLREIERAPS